MSGESQTSRTDSPVTSVMLVIAILACIYLLLDRANLRLDGRAGSQEEFTRRAQVEADRARLDQGGNCADHVCTYVFDPTYGMRCKAEVDRLRPERLETGAEYKRMRENCLRDATRVVTPTTDTEWDQFARDVNRPVPTAAEFSAILRGDRSIWATD